MRFVEDWCRRKIDDLVEEPHPLFEIAGESAQTFVDAFKIFAHKPPLGKVGVCAFGLVFEHFDTVFDEGFCFVGMVCVVHVFVDAYDLFCGGEYGFGVVYEVDFVTKVLFGGM